MANLTEEERAELAARTTLIVTHQRTAALLDSERRLFLSHLLTEKGLDPGKEYNMDPASGELTERAAPDG